MGRVCSSPRRPRNTGTQGYPDRRRSRLIDVDREFLASDRSLELGTPLGRGGATLTDSAQEEDVFFEPVPLDLQLGLTPPCRLYLPHLQAPRTAGPDSGSLQYELLYMCST